MKKLYLFFLFYTAISLCVNSATKDDVILAYPVESIDSLELSKIEFVTDSLTACLRPSIENDTRQIARLMQRGDTAAAKKIYPHKLESIYIVAVNYSAPQFRNNSKPGSFFQVSMIWRKNPSSVYFSRRYWYKSKVREYGYTTINGYKVLLVDMTSGKQYFTVDKNGAPLEITLNDETSHVSKNLSIENNFFDVFKYTKNQDLIRVSSEYPIIVLGSYDE